MIIRVNMPFKYGRRWLVVWLNRQRRIWSLTEREKQRRRDVELREEMRKVLELGLLLTWEAFTIGHASWCLYRCQRRQIIILVVVLTIVY